MNVVVPDWIRRNQRANDERRLYREALQDIAALRNESINADDLLARAIEIARRALGEGVT